MKILYIHQYFKTPEEGGAIRSYHIAKAFVQQKWEVEVITAHNDSDYEFKFIDGIKVHYLPIKYSNNFSFYSRIFAFISFTVHSIFLAVKIKGIDLCYATSTPLTVGIIALVLKGVRSIPYIFEVRDLWPEAPIQLKIIKKPVLKAFLYWIEHKIYKNSRLIIALSPGIEDYINKKNTGKAVYMIPNMSDLDFYKEAINFDYENGKNKLFSIIYFGAIGWINRIYSLLEMAQEAKEFNLNVHFHVVGDGSEYRKIEAEAHIRTLNNIKFHAYKDKYDLRKLLKDADASFISYENIPVMETSSPNKFFDSIAAGKLVIFNIKGWLYELCAESKCGIYINLSQKGDFASKISKFMNNKNLLSSYKLNARNLAEDKFSKEEQLKKLKDIIKNLRS